MNHFDYIDDYDEEIPLHLRDYFMERKIGYIRARILENYGNASCSLLDAGCGTGWHVAALIDAGYDVTGIDASERQIAHARLTHPQCKFICSSMLSLPFPDGSFDVVYAINSLHHLDSPAAQKTALGELRRVTKTGGIIIVHEMNTRNPLIRWYLRFLFPRLKSIDAGNEQWILPSYWEKHYPEVCGPVSYFTFTPDFTPRLLLPFFRMVDRFLESTLLRFWSAHYAVTLRFEKNTL